MAPPGICPQCGDRLPADVPHGVCPKCLLQLGFDDLDEPQERGEQATLDPGGRFSTPTPRELATHFPHLEILDLLGQGGMGAVYRARQKTLDRIVALKVLPTEVGRDPAFAERFTREAQALARLTHPNIVMVFDFGVADGYFYFLMEYVDGVNLRQALSAGHLSPAQALSIVPQICEALQYAHDEGIVHRDIKPENVLLDKRGNVKIADFGLAKLLGSPGGKLTLTGTGQVMGTPHYMAPEQLEKPTEVDHRADIYSLGVVFYELLTGELPIGRFAPPSQKTGGSADLDQVVLRTLEKEPNLRYQHASEVKTAVQTLGAPPSPEPVPVPETPPIPEELRRLRVPFTINELYAGFAKASGCISFEGRSLVLEFEVKDDVLGYVSSGVKSVAVPLDNVASLQLVSNWFGWSNSIEIIAYRLSALENVPRSEQGRATLQIKQRDLPLARQFVRAGRKAMNLDVADEAGSRSRPPIAVNEVDIAETERMVRAPALALLVVGILSCITPLVFPIGALFSTWQMARQHAAEAVIADAQQAQMQAARESAAATAQRTMESTAESGTARAVKSAAEQNSAGHATVEELPPATTAAATGAEATSEEIAAAPAFVMRKSVLLLVVTAIAIVLYVTLSIVIILGAVRMRSLSGYGTAATASVMAALPVHPWFIIGMPIGIWCLAILARRDAREAFRLRERARRNVPPAAMAGKDQMPAKSGMDGPGETSDALRTPAVALMSVGIANALLTMLVGLLLIMKVVGIFEVAAVILSIGVALMQFKGGLHMLRYRSPNVATVGAIAAILPFTLLWIFTLPLGIWALVVLQRAEVQQRFVRAAAGQWGQQVRGSGQANRKVATVLAVIFGILACGFLAGVLFFVASGESPEPATIETLRDAAPTRNDSVTTEVTVPQLNAEEALDR